jgi:hypothetical protein
MNLLHDDLLVSGVLARLPEQEQPLRLILEGLFLRARSSRHASKICSKHELKVALPCS